MATISEKSTSKKPLPSRMERTESDLVIYDGHCVICTSGVRILHRLDWSGRLSFVSLHDPQVAKLAPDLTFDQMMAEIWVIDRQGRKHSGAGAFRYLTRRLFLLWPLMPLLHIPGSLPLWKAIYRNIAAIRYRFGKRTGEDCGETCQVHFGSTKSSNESN